MRLGGEWPVAGGSDEMGWDCCRIDQAGAGRSAVWWHVGHIDYETLPVHVFGVKKAVWVWSSCNGPGWIWARNFALEGL